MKIIFNYLKKLNIKSKIIICIFSLAFLVFTVLGVNARRSKILEDNAFKKIDTIQGYYDNAFSLAFTKEQREFIDYMVHYVDSDELDNSFSEEQLSSPLYYGDEFNSISESYKSIITYMDKYDNSLQQMANSVALEGHDVENVLNRNSDYHSNLKENIYNLKAELKSEYYALLKEKNIDVSILEDFNILVPYSLCKLETDEILSIDLDGYIKKLGNTKDIVKTTLGKNEPYISTCRDKLALVFPEKLLDLLETRANNIEDSISLDKIYCIDDGKEWQFDIILKDYDEEESYVAQYDIAGFCRSVVVDLLDNNFEVSEDEEIYIDVYGEDGSSICFGIYDTLYNEFK